MERSLDENDKYLEYEDDEIHFLLLALLDKEGIEPYKSKFCSYQQVNVDKRMAKFSLTTNQNDKGEPELRVPKTTIFALKEKVFVNIYPTTLPMKYEDR